MEETGPSRNGYHRLDNTQCPDDPDGLARTHVWVSVKELDMCWKHNRWKFHNFRSAVLVLEQPSRVFQHIRPVESKKGEKREETGWCYTARLTRVYTEEGRLTDARQNTVFTVFLNQDCSVFEWGVELADPNDPHSPEGAHDGLGAPHGRFGVLVWEKN